MVLVKAGGGPTNLRAPLKEGLRACTTTCTHCTHQARCAWPSWARTTPKELEDVDDPYGGCQHPCWSHCWWAMRQRPHACPMHTACVVGTASMVKDHFNGNRSCWRSTQWPLTPVSPQWVIWLSKAVIQFPYISSLQQIENKYYKYKWRMRYTDLHDSTQWLRPQVVWIANLQ